MTDAATGADESSTDAAEDDADAERTDAADASEGAEPPARDAVEGAWLAAEVGSLVSASVAFALHLDGSTNVVVPGGSTSALAVTFVLLAFAALAAAGKAAHRDQGLRSVGHAVTAVGLAALAVGGGVVLASFGGLAVTIGTVGVVMAVAGLNLVVFSFLA